MPDCGYCGKPIEADCRICPHCGVTQHEQPVIVKEMKTLFQVLAIFVAVCAAILLGALIVCGIIMPH